jgi:AcrR family transcriptional regulator
MTRAPRKLGRPVDADSAETRQRILVAARRIFAAEGFARTTNRHIAEAAGITPGAIYHYFASKADLYVTVYDECQAEVHRAFRCAAQQRRTFAEQLDAILDAAVELDRADPSLAAFWVASESTRRSHPEIGAQLGSRRAPTAALVHELATRAVERGELAPDVRPTTVEDLVNVVLTGLARLSATVNDVDRHEDVVRLLQQVLAASARGSITQRREPEQGGE